MQVAQNRWFIMGNPIQMDDYNVGPPNVIGWFINPSNYSYKYHKPYLLEL